MPQSTLFQATRSQSGTGSASPARFVSAPPGQRDDEELAVWQPAAPRLRIFSPATPRPSSAAPTSPTHTTTVIVSQPQGCPSPRPASAICGKLSIPGDHDRLVTPAITSPGAGPTTPTPTRAAQILSKAHALQARSVASTAHGPGLAFGAPSTAAAAAAATTGPLVLCDSPPGSPLMVVRSVARTPRPPALITSAAAAGGGGTSSPGGAPVGLGRSRRSSLPEPLLPPCSSSGAVHLPPAQAGMVSSSGAVEGSTAGSPGAGPAAPPLGSSPSGGRIRGLKATISGTGDGGGPRVRSVSPVPGGPRRPQDSFIRETSSGITTDSGESTASEEGCRGDRSGSTTGGGGGGNGGGGGDDSGGGDGPESGGDSAGSGGDSAPPSRNPSALGGGSGRFASVPSAPSPTASPSPSPSPVIWPWPQDASRRSSQAGGSPFAASPTTGSFLHSHLHSHPHLLNQANHPNHHLGHPTHLSLQLDRRTTTLGGGVGGLMTRGSGGLYSPGRPASSAAQVGNMNARTVSFRSRPRSCSSSGGGGGGGGGAGARPTSGVGPRSPSGTGPGPGAAAATAAGGALGSAVAAAVAAAPPTAVYEILPDYHPLPVAAAVPLGGRLARAIAGIVPSGNPGTFNLKLEERIQKVLHEVPVKTPGPKTAATPPNPTVLKMLHDRHEAEAQRSVVDTAFSSGNPAAWMHQIVMAETGAAAPPWAQQQQQHPPGQGPSSQSQSQLQQVGGPALSPRHGLATSSQLPSRQPSRHQNHHTPPQPFQQQQQQQRSHSQLHLLPQNPHPYPHRAGSGSALGGGGGGGGGASQASPQRLTAGLGAGVPRHTSAETLHLQSVSYLASKEACRTLAADSKPAVSINLREVVLEGRPANGGVSPLRPGSAGGAALGLRR